MITILSEDTEGPEGGGHLMLPFQLKRGGWSPEVMVLTLVFFNCCNSVPLLFIRSSFTKFKSRYTHNNYYNIGVDKNK
jgi:hypothetical protein